jgi:hypothetical protein
MAAKTSAPLLSRAQLFDPFDGHGTAIAVAGPPGTGKSTFAGSAAKYGRVALLCPKPREVNSWLYREHKSNIDAEIFHDPKWRPTMGLYEATGFISLAKRIIDLYSDENYDFVVVDPYTDVVALVAHELMKAEKAASPRDLSDSRGFYGGLKWRLKEITQMITTLAHAPHPKHIIVTVHTQPPKDDVGNTEHADSKGKGIEYEGSVLPMIEGGYRREFASEFDAMVYTDVQAKKVRDPKNAAKMIDSVEYRIQVQPDNDRHAKTIFGDAFKDKFVANDFGEILKAVS